MPSMSSWVILVLIFVLAFVTWVPVDAEESLLEHCLRRTINLPSPPSSPPPTVKAYYPWSHIDRYVCNDEFRIVQHYVQLRGKFPTNYLKALCNIFDNNDQKVEHYIKGRIFIQDFKGLVAGRTCTTI
ncbi:hypothetical protein TanjilG_28922 [Lupinus angustifolius]|uniref:Uncharacterized protein n=1 Tax=Lupinus angustifolius TaxID=3871 RepID=A0A4P1QXF4_LUPAN|nr:hypothetical protein TanjilG_28922 [Lupinus angustifolius]